MTLFQSILLFLPLCFVISLVTSALRRETIADIVRQGSRLFLVMVGSIVGICIAVYFIMEWLLDH